MAYESGNVTLKILEGLADFAGNLGDFIEAFLSAGYGASHGSMRRYLLMRKHHKPADPAAQERAERTRLQKTISKLRADGFIASPKNKSAKWKGWLTNKGLSKVALLKKRTERHSFYPETTYQKATGDKLAIVVFDVPERQGTLRYWLRSALKNLGLSKLQKSVWIGRVKIPELFLNDLKQLRLLDAVEIFEVGKTGTLQQVA